MVVKHNALSVLRNSREYSSPNESTYARRYLIGYLARNSQIVQPSLFTLHTAILFGDQYRSVRPLIKSRNNTLKPDGVELN
jgi:hypothetical protein